MYQKQPLGFDRYRPILGGVEREPESTRGNQREPKREKEFQYKEELSPKNSFIPDKSLHL